MSQTLVHAAQNALIINSDATIRSAPFAEADPIETRKSGETIRISSFQKDGWFKVRATNGQFGWIWQADIAVDSETPEIRSASIDLLGKSKYKVSRDQPWLYFRPMLTLYSLSAANIGGYRFNYSIHSGMNFDLRARVDNTLSFDLRAGYYQTPKAGADYIEITRRGVPVLLGAEFTLSRTNKSTNALVILAGMDYSVISIDATKEASPNSTSATQFTPIGWISYMQKKKIGLTTSFIWDLGVFYSPIKSSRVTVYPFMEPAGNPNTVVSHYSGVAMNFGLELPL